ncbi:MAG: hypothetical protein WBG02_11545 [Candidatus Acidiferrum sp.]
MSSQFLVTIRIDAEVIEGIGVGIVEIFARRWAGQKAQGDQALPPASERASE